MSASAVEVEDEARYAKPILDPEGLRLGRLKLMAECPLMYLANVQGKSAALDKGTATHSILLGGKRVIYYDGKVKPTKDNPNPTKIGPRNGSQWEEFKALNSDATILSLEEYDESNRIADAVRNCKPAMEVLSGVCEQTLHFEMLGFQCRSTPDVRANDGRWVTELKTCKSSNPRRFSQQARQMNYHAQMSFHREGMKRNGLIQKGVTPEPFIVAVCSSAPYPVTVFRVPPKAMDAGDKSIRLWMEQLKGCISSRHFPAYSQTVVDMDWQDDDGPTFADGELESADPPF